jgi:hypothetical protein
VLGPIGSILAGVAAILMILIFPLFGFFPALVFGLFSGIGLMCIAVKDRNQESYADKMIKRTAFRQSVKNGTDLYLPGSLTHFGAHKLPGVLADSELAQFRDKNDSLFTVLRYPSDRTFVIPIACDPDGSSLVDAADLEKQIEVFGEWLASLAYEPNLLQAAITIETSQDPGNSLVREMTDHGSPDASPLSKTWAKDLQESYPRGASRVRASASLSYQQPKTEIGMDGKKIKNSDALEAIGTLVSDRLENILNGLSNTGAGHVHAMTPDELIETVRCAYNPADRRMFDQLASAGQAPPVMLWDSVGAPGQAFWNHYQHGDATSITWEATGFVSAQVMATALQPILEPSPKVAVKRVTILYKPMDPSRSGIAAESAHQAAEGRIKNAKKPSARQAKVLREADQTRQREASGAGLMDFAILVTGTTLEAEGLPIARSTVEHLGPTARLHLHAMNGTQDSSFAQAIGVLGLVTEQHLAIPTAISKGI